MSESKKHAILSPSGADRWMTCLGSVALSKDLPDQDNEYSIEGTDYHELAALCLEEGTDAAEYIGHPMASGENYVTEENAKYLQEGYINVVRAMVGVDGTLLVEEKCPISHLTGERDAEGTSDATIIKQDRELIVADLKFGRGVEVSVEDNRQCKIYALGVTEKHQLQEEIDQVRLVICQPRAGDGKPKEWVIGLPQLLEFGVEVRKIAQTITLNNGLASVGQGGKLPLVPSEKACKFCKAKSICPALADLAKNQMLSGFTDESKPVEVADLVRKEAIKENPQNPGEVLGHKMDLVDLLEIYLLGVRSAVEIELLAGNPVVGKDGPYKLVQGKKGNRAWDNKEDVETLFKKTFRMKKADMYDFSLISPTTAEKKLKKAHPQRWEVTEAHITQSEGKLHVASALDDRPAIDMAKPTDGFVNEENNDDLL